MSIDGLPDAGYLRFKQVLEIIPVSRSTWWQGIKDGRFPKGVKLGARMTAWRVEDIRSLMARIDQGCFGELGL
jgi:prophage regulatory protein